LVEWVVRKGGGDRSGPGAALEPGGARSEDRRRVPLRDRTREQQRRRARATIRPVDHAFGKRPGFPIGVEEELLLVEPTSLGLAQRASQLLERLPAQARPDVYESLLETASGVRGRAEGAVTDLLEFRAAMRHAGATLMGAGVHPTARFGDVRHVPQPRYDAIHAALRGLLERTPTCALHVHVGMPDPETAIDAANRMRSHLPLLQALAANSPYWHGRDSGFATARAQLFRGYPRAIVPRAFADWDDYATSVEHWVAAAEISDYTFLWWDLRPHPKLGTIEVRAMDAQARPRAVLGLAALIHALAVASADGQGAIESAEAITESTFRAGRDGLDARLWWKDGMRPAREVAAETLALARAYAAEVGEDDALGEVERILAEGNGADRMRAAHERGGMRGVLERLVSETDERRQP
jgi:carboxylate-amine ligase